MKELKLHFEHKGFLRYFWGVVLIPVVLGVWIAYVVFSKDEKQDRS